MTPEALTAGAVARRLGVAVTTLRTWHQRYGLGPSQHLPGQHRRYTTEDLARLEVMRRLTAEGVAPAEAARWARNAPQAGAAGSAGQPDAGEDPPTPGAVRNGGGNTIPVGRAGPVARGLARAAMRLDAQAIREALRRSVADSGVVNTWDDVIVPVLIGIGHRHAATMRLVEVEHLLSRGVSETLAAVPRPRNGTGSPQVVLLACANEEQHTLPLEAVAAALAECGVDCRLLGARVPPDALADAVARTAPAVVVIWSQLPATADPAQLTALLSGAHRPMLVVAAGPGWRRETLPAEVVIPTGLADAVDLVLDTVNRLDTDRPDRTDD